MAYKIVEHVSISAQMVFCHTYIIHDSHNKLEIWLLWIRMLLMNLNDPGMSIGMGAESRVP